MAFMALNVKDLWTAGAQSGPIRVTAECSEANQLSYPRWEKIRWEIPARGQLPPVVFTQAEALGLVMAVLDGQPTAADVDDLVGSALGKVIQALPESVGRQAAALREHASTAPDRYSARPDPATTSALVAAVAVRRP
jgi:predicted DNA-binding transcriptional regulator YafY